MESDATIFEEASYAVVTIVRMIGVVERGGGGLPQEGALPCRSEGQAYRASGASLRAYPQLASWRALLRLKSGRLQCVVCI